MEWFFKLLFRFMKIGIILIFVSTLAAGCNINSDGDGEDNNTSEASKWDSMVWDQGKWE